MTKRPDNCPEHSCCLLFLKKAFRTGLLSFGLLMGMAAMSHGSAFSITELGARATGMGTAFIGLADDGSALFYNPAGIAFQPGAHLQMDGTVVVGLFRFTPSSTPVGQIVPANGFSESIRPHFIPLAFMYATKQISPKITLGMGIFTPFGLAANSTNFHDSDPNLTKFVSRFAGTRVRLESIWFQPTIAYKLKENLSVAIGPALVHNHLELEESILNPLDPDGALKFGRTAAPTVLPGVPVSQAAAIIARLLPEGRSRIAGTNNAPALSAGVLWKNPRTKTNVGFMFRSSIENHLSGKASFAFGNQPYALEQYVGSHFLPNAFPSQKITGLFPTPATYGLGVSNSRFWNTTFALDVRLQDYSKFKTVPLSFSINEDNEAKLGLKNIGLPATKFLNFDFRESWNIALGAERPLNPAMTVRAGFLYDRTPVTDESVGPLFPDSSRLSFTLGATRKSGNKELTIYYEAMKFLDRTTNFAANDFQWTNGDYHNFAHIFGFSLRMDVTDFKIRRP
jgi:long-chain fatty acid transport protein